VSSSSLRPGVFGSFDRSKNAPTRVVEVSGGTHSEAGRDCPDTLLGLMHTYSKLGIAFWDYLGDRLAVPDHPDVPFLPGLIRC